MIPGCDYRTSLSRGDVGADTYALQINLNAWVENESDELELVRLVEDGDYGGRTYRRVRTFQRRRDLWVDGVSGFRTQKALALELLEPRADAHQLPHGLLRGQVELESSYYVGAVNCRVSGAKDCGWTQRRIKDGSTEMAYRDAFYGPYCFEKSAAELRNRKDAYYNPAPQAIRDHEYMWKCAVLAHNWPAAAEKKATGGFDDWEYIASFDESGQPDEGRIVLGSDGKRRYGVDDDAQWVMNIGVTGISTGRQWSDYYVGKVTVYVSEYGP